MVFRKNVVDFDRIWVYNKGTKRSKSGRDSTCCPIPEAGASEIKDVSIEFIEED